jgi:putative acetyltransferase
VVHPFLSADFLDEERVSIPNVYLPKAETWVWETDGRVIGFISLLGNEVGALFVHPDFIHGPTGFEMLRLRLAAARSPEVRA